ncbi:MAG: response regulator [Sandaracinaceae bacterium]
MPQSQLPAAGSVLDPADPPMIVRDADAGGFLRVNEAFGRKVGFSRADLAQQPLLDWIDPRDHARLRERLVGGEGSIQVRHRTKDGEGLPLELNVTRQAGATVVLGHCAESQEAIAPEEGDAATVSGTLHRIARIVEEQNPGYKCSILLVEDGHFVRGAGPSLPEEYNSAIDGFAIGPHVGSCGTAIFWNVRVVVEDIQRDPLWKPFAELAKRAGVAACWSNPFTSGSGAVLGALALYSPVPRAPTELQLRNLRAAARMTGLAVERGRAEEALREQRLRELELEEQLRQAAKMEALGVLAGGVAHDFNNVLATILANAEFALELISDDAPDREMLTEIAAASQRAGGFCKQMLSYAGRGSIESSKLEVGALLGELRGLVHAGLSKKTTLAYALHDTPVFVNGDQNQLLQVMMNLVMNAAEAQGDETGRIDVRSSIARHNEDELAEIAPQEALPAGEYVTISVEDDGCGMDAQTIARIFDPFFTTKLTGRGLGLAAAKGIILNHHGAMTLKSEPGVGTTFTILLPTVAVAKPARPSSQAPDATQTSAHVLVVDDEDGLRSILARRLRHQGFEVTEAEDGDRAIEVFTAQPDVFDCVLLDLSMPKRGGDEVFSALREIRSDLPVILMSGYAAQEVMEKFPADGIAGTLQKPIQGNELLTTIRDTLDRASVEA